MMSKKMASIVGLVLVLVMAMTFTVSADAQTSKEDRKKDIPTTGYPAKGTSSSSQIGYDNLGQAQTRASGNLIWEGNAYIGIYSGTKLLIEGDTSTFGNVDSIEVELTLQQYKNGSWENIRIWSKSDENCDYVHDENFYYVASGYYYRVYGYHEAFNVDPFELDYADHFTGYIWVE